MSFHSYRRHLGLKGGAEGKAWPSLSRPAPAADGWTDAGVTQATHGAGWPGERNVPGGRGTGRGDRPGTQETRGTLSSFFSLSRAYVSACLQDGLCELLRAASGRDQGLTPGPGALLCLGARRCGRDPGWLCVCL